MARQVKTTPGVRAWARQFDVRKMCAERRLLERYEFAIIQTTNAWTGDLEHEAIDRLIIVGLEESLRSETWIEEDLEERYELPPGWTLDDDNWTRYRTAIAVMILQAYYDFTLNRTHEP